MKGEIHFTRHKEPEVSSSCSKAYAFIHETFSSTMLQTTLLDRNIAPQTMAIKKDFMKESCKSFLDTISSTRTKMSSEEKFLHLLSNLHKSYMKFHANMHTYLLEPATTKVRLLNATLDLQTYSAHSFTMLYHLKHGVLSIDTKFADLDNKILVKARALPTEKQVSEVEKLFNIYFDIRDRKCDECGMYTLLPSYELPLCRVLIDHMVYAYHPSCKEEKHEY